MKNEKLLTIARKYYPGLARSQESRMLRLMTAAIAVERERAARLLDKRAEQVSRPVSLAVHRWHGQELKQLAAAIRSGAEPDAE